MSAALPPPLDAEHFDLEGPWGRLTGFVAGDGPPMLLVHSVNAAACAAEVKPLFDHYRRSHTVFAYDMPGYGLSDRRDIAYTPRLMTDALLAVARLARTRCGNATLDALALSLATEFLARAGVESPELWRSLGLVSPTGFSGRSSWRKPPGTTRALPWLHAALAGPGWGGAVFRGLTRPGVIRYFLERTWGSRHIDEGLWAYDVLTTRQPGAEHAPLHFLSASMFSADIHTVYESLKMPVWMSHGVRGDFVDYRGKTTVQGRPNWRIDVFPTGAMPYFERPREFSERFDAFLAAQAGV
jgi:pimeloyl-ACP methyl ester carboxylesterase